ncbi:helix-turn-helix domain-containing protein [Qingshengfaniella alkalisoli]|nr:helix-turn-helix domain-containing protein [Qingshengfaniella alkalisoli]
MEQNPHVEARDVSAPLGRAEFGLARDRSYVVMLSSGRGVVHDRGRPVQIEAGRVVWLPAGQSGRLVLEAGSRGLYLILSDIGLMRCVPSEELGLGPNAMLGRSFVLSFSDRSEWQSVLGHLQSIRDESYQAGPGSGLVVENLSVVIFILLWRRARVDQLISRSVPRSIVETFVRLASRHARDHWKITDYAEAIGVSRDRLKSAILRATGVSPQAYLHRELYREARDLLMNSGLQVSEIAFRLGFQDPAYFNRFFARHEGQPPGKFRRMTVRRDDRSDRSFAAWP